MQDINENVMSSADATRFLINFIKDSGYSTVEEVVTELKSQSLLSGLENSLDGNTRDIISVILNGEVEELEESRNETLNNDLYDESGDLKEDVKNTLLKIVDKFKESFDDELTLDVKDVIIVGSNANYNYTEYSDIDLHIVADTSKFEDKAWLVERLYNAYKSLFNSKYEPLVRGHEVEIYVEPNESTANSNGVYSLYNGWIKEPVKDDIPEVDLEPELSQWLERANKILGEEILDEAKRNKKRKNRKKRKSSKNIVYNYIMPMMPMRGAPMWIGNGPSGIPKPVGPMPGGHKLPAPPAPPAMHASVSESFMNGDLNEDITHTSEKDKKIAEVEEFGYKFNESHSIEYDEVICLVFDNPEDKLDRLTFNSLDEIDEWVESERKHQEDKKDDSREDGLEDFSKHLKDFYSEKELIDIADSNGISLEDTDKESVIKAIVAASKENKSLVSKY